MKTLIKRIAAFAIVVFMLAIDLGPVQATDIAAADEQQQLNVVLNGSLEQYIQQQGIENDSEIAELIIATDSGYMLSMKDLETIQTNFQMVKTIDAVQASFDSEDTFNAFKSCFLEQWKIAYTYSEDSFPIETVSSEENIVTPEPDENDIPSTEVKAGYSVSLDGICVIEKGNKMEVGAAYSSNDPNVQFRWLQYDLQSQKWSGVTDWYSGNWAVWKPQKAGDYWIYVEAKTSDGTMASSVYGYHYKGTQVELSGIYILDKGTRLDMGVGYKSNDSGLVFRWLIYDLARDKWTTIQEKSSGNWTSWTPQKAGDYWIHVEAYDSNNNITAYTMGYHFGGLKVELNGICTIEQDKQIDAGVAYTTNDSKVQFRWQEYNLSTKKWRALSDWNSGNWCSWKPSRAGDYWLYVEAKTSDGQVKSQVMGYRINGVRISSFSVSPKSPNWVGSNIQLKGKYKDLLDEVGSERYLIYDGKSWKELAKTGTDVIWTPEVTGSYLACYEIYDKSGKLIEQSFQGYSIENPYVNLNGIYVRQDAEMEYAMAVSSNTNDREIQYRWLYYDIGANKWNEISGWSNSNAAYWKAPREGAYWIHVEAKLHNGSIKTHTMGFTVERIPIDVKSMMLYANLYSSNTPYIIMTNLNTRKVGVFQGWQGNWNCIKYFDCTVGAPGTPTVTGVFKVGSRGYYFDSGNSRCFWYTQFYGNYLFHSVLYNKNGTLQDGRLGMALSHGCVRLQIDNAKWIYDAIPSGTTVVVY